MATASGKSPAPIATQSLIVVNGVTDPNILTNRQMQASTAGSKASVIGYGALDAPRLAIHEGEMLMMPVNFNFPGQSATMRRPFVFSSFNGIPVDEDMSQDAFEDEYVWMGMAHTSTAPEGDPLGMANGISIKRGGSGTTFNNSTDTFSPGDVIGFQLPSVDGGEREIQAKRFGGTRIGRDQTRFGKHVAMLRKITYEDISDQFDLATARLYTNVGKTSVPEREQSSVGGLFRPVDGVDEMAVLIKKAFNWAFVSSMIAAEKTGLIQFTGLNATTPQEQIAELASKVGLVKTSTREDDSLQNEYFMRLFAGSASKMGRVAQKNIIDRLNDDLISSVPLPPTFAQSGKRETTTEQLMHVAKTATSDLVKVYGQCMNRFERKIIGTASTYSTPGTSIDYVLRP